MTANEYVVVPMCYFFFCWNSTERRPVAAYDVSKLSFYTINSLTYKINKIKHTHMNFIERHLVEVDVQDVQRRVPVSIPD